MNNASLNRRIAAIEKKLQPESDKPFMACVMLPDNGREPLPQPDRRIPLVLYNAVTQEILPEYAPIYARVHRSAKIYGFDPSCEGSEP